MLPGQGEARPSVGEAFHGDDLRAMGTRCRDEACHHGLAIQKYRTCATFTFGAAFFRADQIAFFTQQTEQGFIVSAVEGVFLSIDGCFDGGGGGLMQGLDSTLSIVLRPTTGSVRSASRFVPVHRGWTSTRAACRRAPSHGDRRRSHEYHQWVCRNSS